ncbi:MAG: Elongation factor Ts [Bacteroidetes bacterium ADurb.Bin408]|nr:MAG: Elongation factor Ts [Bacteroidetes bacterium ADurb.Bin408]
MANITASEINKLRQITGAGMMDCKKALVEADGDYDKAIEYLRKKGQKLASTKADRNANEGIVLCKTNPDNSAAVIIMLNCETDFVARNQEFIDFANEIVDYAIANKTQTLEQILDAEIKGRKLMDRITDYIGKIGEKIVLAHYYYLTAPYCAAYNHNGNRIGTIVTFNKKDTVYIEEITKNIAMQITAMNPVAVDKSDVSPQVVEREIEIGKEQARQEGKPEAMLEKIAIGKLEKFYKESTLLNQEYIKESKMTVRQYIAQADKDLVVNEFRRLQLGA